MYLVLGSLANPVLPVLAGARVPAGLANETLTSVNQPQEEVYLSMQIIINEAGGRGGRGGGRRRGHNRSGPYYSRGKCKY